MKTIVLNCLLLFCLVSISCAASMKPQEQMEHMFESAFNIIQLHELSPEEKKSQLSELVQNTLHLKSMVQRILGSSLAVATEQQRQRFTGLFVKVLEGTYLNRISNYSGAKVIYLQQLIKENKAILDTRIVSNGLDVPVRYKMIFDGDRWWVFDVIIEGVSLVRIYQSSYSEIIRRDGLAGLCSLMEEKIVEMDRI